MKNLQSNYSNYVIFDECISKILYIYIYIYIYIYLYIYIYIYIYIYELFNLQYYDNILK